MLIYVIDSDYEALKSFDLYINTGTKDKAKCFTNIKSLTNAVKAEKPDVVFLDFDITNSSTAVKTIRKEFPEIKIVIMSQNPDKGIELFNLNLNGFFQKPFSDEKIKQQLFNIKHPFLSKLGCAKKERNIV